MTKDVPVRDIKAKTSSETLEVGSWSKTLFEVKQTDPYREEMHHVLLTEEEAKILRNLLTEWLDEFPSGPFNVVKLKPLEVYQRMERGTRFTLNLNNLGYYIKLDEDSLYWVNESDSRHNNVKTVKEFFSEIEQDGIITIIKGDK